MIETNWCSENGLEDEDWNYRTGHLWDIVFVLYNCVQTAIVILKNDIWRDLIKKYSVMHKIFHIVILITLVVTAFI